MGIFTGLCSGMCMYVYASTQTTNQKDVFSRLADAEPIETKTATEVQRTFRTIVERYKEENPDLPDPLQGLILTTDRGGKFQGVFREYLANNGGAWRTRPVGSKNDIAVLDRAMGQFKLELKQHEKNNGTTNFARWNESYNSTLHGSPVDVVQHPETRFLNMQDNARKFAHSHQNDSA